MAQLFATNSGALAILATAKAYSPFASFANVGGKVRVQLTTSTATTAKFRVNYLLIV